MGRDPGGRPTPGIIPSLTNESHTQISCSSQDSSVCDLPYIEMDRNGVTFVFFVFGERLVAFPGSTGLNVITRLMGLILAVIGVQMLIEGIDGAVAAAG